MLGFFDQQLLVYMASSSTLTTKQKVGLDMLSEALEGDFGAAFSVLVKVLGNLVANPDEAKFRKLRTSNAKIQAMLATKGVRALLVGSGIDAVKRGPSPLAQPTHAQACPPAQPTGQNHTYGRSSADDVR